jgi:hypothetical protein
MNHGKGGSQFLGEHHNRETVYEFDSTYGVKEYS